MIWAEYLGTNSKDMNKLTVFDKSKLLRVVGCCLWYDCMQANEKGLHRITGQQILPLPPDIRAFLPVLTLGKRKESVRRLLLCVLLVNTFTSYQTFSFRGKCRWKLYEEEYLRFRVNADANITEINNIQHNIIITYISISLISNLIINHNSNKWVL